MKIIVSYDYLLRLAKNALSDAEVLEGYFKYYFCQGRNLGDMKVDYHRMMEPHFNREQKVSPFDCSLFQNLQKEEIKEAIHKVEDVLNRYLKLTFDLELQEGILL